MAAITPRRETPAPKNMGELRESLCDMYAACCNDRAMVPQADAAANVAGKIINTVKMELEAAKMMGRELSKANTQWLLGPAPDKKKVD